MNRSLSPYREHMGKFPPFMPVYVGPSKAEWGKCTGFSETWQRRNVLGIRPPGYSIKSVDSPTSKSNLYRSEAPNSGRYLRKMRPSTTGCMRSDPVPERRFINNRADHNMTAWTSRTIFKRGSKTSHRRGWTFSGAPRFLPTNIRPEGNLNTTGDKGPGEYLGMVEQFGPLEEKGRPTISRGGFRSPRTNTIGQVRQKKLVNRNTGYPHYQSYVVEEY